MSEERQHPGILLYMACIIAVPVVYALSIGPVAGILSRTDSYGPEWVTGAAYVYLLPAQFVYDNSPEPVKKVVEVYVDFFD